MRKKLERKENRRENKGKARMIRKGAKEFGERERD